MAPPSQSLIIPVYKNAANIPTLLEALRDLHTTLEKNLEVVFVVDGSPDESLQLLQAALPNEPYPAQLVELSRNFGSFPAIRHGLQVAQGDYFAAMAADLQEPPELIARFFELLRADQADLVIGQRANRADGRLSGFLSNTYWALYRKFVVSDIPAGGVDVFGCNEKIRDHLLSLREANTSLVSQLFWLGHRRVLVPYERRARAQGKSAWNLRRKIRYMLDSVFAFSDLPIFVLLWLGGLGILLSVLIALIVLGAWLAGAITVQGYTPVMLLIAFIGSILIFGQGIIGCYVWRAAENTKQRPLSLVQSQRSYRLGQPENNRSQKHYQ